MKRMLGNLSSGNIFRDLNIEPSKDYVGPYRHDMARYTEEYKQKADLAIAIMHNAKAMSIISLCDLLGIETAVIRDLVDGLFDRYTIEQLTDWKARVEWNNNDGT